MEKSAEKGMSRTKVQLLQAAIVLLTAIVVSVIGYGIVTYFSGPMTGVGLWVGGAMMSIAGATLGVEVSKGVLSAIDP